MTPHPHEDSAAMPDHTPTTDDREPARVSWPFLAQLAAIIVSVMLAYGVLNERISVLEVKYDRIQQDIGEIKADVKELLKRP